MGNPPARPCWFFLRAALALALPWACPARAADVREGDAERARFFEARVRPVLIDHCYKCHGQDPAKIKGKLRLDSPAALLKGGSSGQPAVVPGEPGRSLLIRAIHYTDPDLQMPPKEPLTPEQVADLEHWVASGALDPRPEPAGASLAKAPVGATTNGTPSGALNDGRPFWSFVAPREPAPPAVKDAAWATSDIDRFILAKLEEKGLTPAAPAEARVLLRRATFDLTGLPPTPEEVDAFLADRRPDAFARVIDRLLASAAYGERWGRHWLDLARYADTAGDASDYPIPQAYKYRNYVIDAFNHDKPYDQFLREQIAGDLLPAADQTRRNEQVIATGFLAVARRFEVPPGKAIPLTIDDTIDTTGRAVLGLTVGCARCHDHKFDPIPTKDYYGLYGIFSSTRYPYAGAEGSGYQRDLVPLVPAEQAVPALVPFYKRLSELEAEVVRCRKAVEEAEDQATQNKLQAKKGAAEKAARQWAATAAPPFDTAYAVSEGTPADARVFRRGDPTDPGEAVPRGFLSALGGQRLPPEVAARASGRLQLAAWMTDPANPLTARVMVNRIWQYHFGRGIVATPNDFGTRGTPPTHPELLDYLAARFVKSGWSIKAMHRAIMLSRAYQLSAGDDARDSQANQQVDPNNLLHWRFDRRRLDAEELRDSILAVSGTLDRAMQGPHPFPSPRDWNYTQHAAFSAEYETRARSVYLMTQRLKRHRYLGTFDGPDPNASTPVRLVTTTPLQALFSMNAKFVHEQADRLADRLAAQPTDEGRVTAAYRLAFGRPPTAEEREAAVSYLMAYREKLMQGGEAADPADHGALASLARVVFGSNEFVFVD